MTMDIRNGDVSEVYSTENFAELRARTVYVPRIFLLLVVLVQHNGVSRERRSFDFLGGSSWEICACLSQKKKSSWDET